MDDNGYQSDTTGSILTSKAQVHATRDLMGQNIVKEPSNPVTIVESIIMCSSPCKSYDMEAKIEDALKSQDLVHEIRATIHDINGGEEDSPNKFSEQPDPLKCGPTVRRAVSDSQSLNLSDTLDAVWLGKSQPETGKVSSIPLMGSISVDSSLAAVAERLALEKQVEDRGVPEIPPFPSSVPPANSKDSYSADTMISWLGMPFLNFYRSLNVNLLGSAQKLDTFGGYNPMYVSSAQKLRLQGGAKWLLPLGLNETVIPVYDDEPTSIISYALASEDYQIQPSDVERAKESFNCTPSLPCLESASFLSLDEPMINHIEICL